MKKTNKVISLVLALVMALSILVVIPTASATSTVRINEVNANVGYSIVYNIYLQTDEKANTMEGSIPITLKMVPSCIFPMIIPKSIVVTTAWLAVWLAILSELAATIKVCNARLDFTSSTISRTFTGSFLFAVLTPTKFSGLSIFDTPIQQRISPTADTARQTLQDAASISTE